MSNMIKGFAYHGITVSNLDRSVAFYRDNMGMKLEHTYEMSGGPLEKATSLPGAHAKAGILSLRGNLLKLTQYLAPKGKNKFETKICDVGASHLAIQVGNVNETYDRLKARGVNFMAPPVLPYPDNPRIMFTYMLDPDNTVVELHLGSYDNGRIIGKFHHSYTITNMDKTTAFYKDFMGMKVLRIGKPRGRRIEMGTGLSNVDFTLAHMGFDDDESIEFFDFVSPRGVRDQKLKLCDVGSSQVAFLADDVEKVYRDFKARGAKFISEPVHPVTGRKDVTMVYMLDPDNYAVELRSGDLLVG